ncbi:MAG TPA: NAD(P)-binding protein [Rhizomicrobium sp.]|nr:NAD(P)-binding protein [Rhizomicrobium sp.]
MAERYDAAIVGAGPDGLAAATLLAGAGLRTIMLEHQPQSGGMFVTREFHPGFFAAPFADEAPPLDDALFWRLDLARHGAWKIPASRPIALWPDRRLEREPFVDLFAEVERRRANALALANRPAPSPPPRWNPFARRTRLAWPAEDWSHRSLAALAAEHAPSEAQAALLVAGALEGRAADPYAAGSALHLLAPGSGEAWRGALGGLGTALAAAAREAGAEIVTGVGLGDIRCHKGRVSGVGHADGNETAARAVISTLDLKRTFLGLFSWSTLDKGAVNRIANFRIAGATARLLVALSERPSLTGGLPRGAIQIAPELRQMVEAHAAWKSGVVPERPPMTLYFGSASDPALAPIGAAVLTATIGCIPHTPFDGVWTHDKRELLTRRLLTQIEEVLPGIGRTVLATELLVPPDMEEALGATAGDLWGGEIAPDQMFAWRPGFARDCPHTPVDGLYLAGPSTAAGPLQTCASGVIAAEALIADLRAGRLA